MYQHADETLEPGQTTHRHRWEMAGLGQYPYRSTGVEVKTYQACPGAPIQPGTSCDYCGQGIMYVCNFRSADGHDFKVGLDCAQRSGDHGMLKLISKLERQIKDLKKAESDKRSWARIDAAIAALPGLEAALKAEPHPYEYHAKNGLTRYDWAEWMFKCAGLKGQMDVTRYIAKLVKAAK